MITGDFHNSALATNESDFDEGSVRSQRRQIHLLTKIEITTSVLISFNEKTHLYTIIRLMKACSEIVNDLVHSNSHLSDVVYKLS